MSSQPVAMSLPVRNQFSFKSLGHAFATVVSDAVKVGKALLRVAEKVAGDEKVVEAITSLVDPALVPAERAAYALLGQALQAVHDAGAAADAQGVNIALDAAAVADLKAIYAFALAELKKRGIVK